MPGTRSQYLFFFNPKQVVLQILDVTNSPGGDVGVVLGAPGTSRHPPWGQPHMAGSEATAGHTACRRDTASDLPAPGVVPAC